MANNNAAKKKTSNPEQRAKRLQQIMFASLAVIMILTMLISLLR